MEPDISCAALIIVDMQNDFLHPNGGFGQRALREPARLAGMSLLGKTIPMEPLAKLSARAREFPSEYTTGSRRSTISSDSQRIWRRATSFRSFQASRSCPRPRAYGQGGRRGLHSAAT